MTSGSALLGNPPANARDQAIIRGLARMAGIPDSKITPGMPFPPHITRGTEDYTSRQTEGIVGMSVALAVVVLITALRIWLRLFRRELRPGLDDVFIIIAACGAAAWFGVCIPIYYKGGVGKHFWDVTYEEYFWTSRLAGIDITVFYVTVGLAAISIALFNRRITGLTSERWQYAHIAFLAVMTIETLIGLFLPTLSCAPPGIQYNLVRYGDNPTPPVCLKIAKIGLGLSVLHIICQWSLLCVPIIILYLVHLPFTKKVRLVILFSFGSLSAIASIMRQVYQQRSTEDVTWNIVDIAAWTAVDLVFVMVAASLPVLNAALPQGVISSRIKSLTQSKSYPNGNTPQAGGGLGTKRRSAGAFWGSFGSIWSDTTATENSTWAANTRPDGTVIDPEDKDVFHIHHSNGTKPEKPGKGEIITSKELSVVSQHPDSIEKDEILRHGQQRTLVYTTPDTLQIEVFHDSGKAEDDDGELARPATGTKSDLNGRERAPTYPYSNFARQHQQSWERVLETLQEKARAINCPPKKQSNV